MTLGEYALQLMMARLKAEETGNKVWLTEIGTRIKELVNYVRWRGMYG